MAKSAVKRFMDKFHQYTEGCWPWEGATSDGGYGLFWNGSKVVSAHRFAWEIKHGKIPEGLEIDHMCRVRHCVREAHLRLVTSAENQRFRAMVPPKPEDFPRLKLENYKHRTGLGTPMALPDVLIPNLDGIPAKDQIDLVLAQAYARYPRLQTT